MAQFPPAMAPQPFDFGGMLINNVSSFPSNSHLANQPPPAACQVPFTGMASLPNALINNFSSNPNFGFNRPFSAKSPAQLRRASSASMEAGKGGRMGSSSMAQLNGGGTRPASLQHHELLFLGPDPHQQQRTTPVPRKFEPVEATLVEDRVEEQKTAADAGRAQTPVQPKEQHSGLLRRNNSMSSGDHQQTSSSISGGGGGGGPQSAFPTLGDYSMFSSSNMAPNSLQANSASANADSNVTLWQFLLELLAANDHPNLIQWTNNEGEFKLLDAEAVARLWGIRKGKPNMNYDKLSRALRYYYDKNIIKKVIGQKFVYRFVMDGKQSGGGDLGLGMAGNPELVKYAINKAQNGIMNGGGEKRAPEAPRFEHNGSSASSHHPTAMLNPHQRSHPATASCSSLADSSSKAAPSSSSTLNPPPNHRGTLNGGNPTTMTPSPVNSSSSPAGSVESSSGVSSGSGMSASFAVPNMGGGQFLGLVPVKSEPGVAGTLAGGGHGQYNTSPSTASTSAGGPPPSFGGPAPLLVEKVRLNRKRKSPLESHQHQQSSLTVSHSGMASSSSSAAFDRQQSHEDGSAPKMGCNNTGPSLSRRGRPQPLDLTSVNNSSVSHLTGQMSQMVASSPLLYALQQHHHHQQQQQQQSPLLSAALLSSALSNYAASPLASVASPLAQAAAFQLASNLVATLSPSMNQNSNAGCGTSGMANYGFNTGSNGNGQNSNNCLNTGNLYSQLHSALRRTSEAPNSWDNSNNIGSFLGGPKEDGYALTTPISQVKTPLQQQQPPLSNSAMISAVINHLTNGPNTPFQHHQQQQQQQAQQQQQLFQFPASSNMANLAQTLAMLSSPGMPLANQSPFPFVSQMASLQTPKFSAVNLQAGNQRSPDSLKTPMGGLSFEFGQALAAAAANKK